MAASELDGLSCRLFAARGSDSTLSCTGGDVDGILEDDARMKLAEGATIMDSSIGKQYLSMNLNANRTNGLVWDE